MISIQFIETLTVDERTKYDEYGKAQIYEAYILEVQNSEKLTKIIHQLERHLAKIRFEVNNGGNF